MYEKYERSAIHIFFAKDEEGREKRVTRATINKGKEMNEINTSYNRLK